MMTGRFLNRIVFDLHFVTVPQIDAAVGVVSAVELGVQLESLEPLLADDLRTMSRGDQRPVFHFPRRRRIRVAHLPSSQILPIEQRNRLSPLRRAFSLEKRCPYGGPCPGRSIGPGERSRESLPVRFSDKDHVGGRTFLFFGRNESDLAAGDFNFGQRASVPPTSHHLRDQASVFVANLQPRGILAVGTLESQIPTSRKKLNSVRRRTLVAVCSLAKGAGKRERKEEERGASESGSAVKIEHGLLSRNRLLQLVSRNVGINVVTWRCPPIAASVSPSVRPNG